MFQITVQGGVITNLTWKRRRGGQATVKKFVVTTDKVAAIRFDDEQEATMVAQAVTKAFGLLTNVKKLDRRRMS